MNQKPATRERETATPDILELINQFRALVVVQEKYNGSLVLDAGFNTLNQ